MTEAAERWSACSIATAAWPRTWRQPADRGVSWRSQGRWRRARPHRPNSETGSKLHFGHFSKKSNDFKYLAEIDIRPKSLLISMTCSKMAKVELSSTLAILGVEV